MPNYLGRTITVLFPQTAQGRLKPKSGYARIVKLWKAAAHKWGRLPKVLL